MPIPLIKVYDRLFNTQKLKMYMENRICKLKNQSFHDKIFLKTDV